MHLHHAQGHEERLGALPGFPCPPPPFRLPVSRSASGLIEGDAAVALFEARIRDKGAQGLTVARLNEDGQVRELTVFFRPLETLQLIAEVIGARMAAEFGPLGKQR